MSALPAPDAPLQIEWQPVPLQLDASGQTQIVKKPRTTLQTYIPGCEPVWQDTDEVSLQQFFTELQTYLQHSLQNQLTRGSQALLIVQEHQEAQNALMREALEYMKIEVNSVQEELRRYAERDELDTDAMEIDVRDDVRDAYQTTRVHYAELRVRLTATEVEVSKVSSVNVEYESP